MTRVSLSAAGDYRLVNDEQDIRGRTVVDGTGQPLGTVGSMLLDTDQEHVTALVLEDGTEIPMKDVTLGDDVVYDDAGGTTAGAGASAGSGRPGAAVFADGGRGVRRERVADTDDASAHDASVHGADFQAHHASTYGASGRTYAQMQPAYADGLTARSAYDGDFDTHEASMRSDYESRHGGSGDSMWDDVKDAVRHGFTRARNAVS